MWRHNDGRSEAEVLQNRFTAYVTTAVRRQRKAYILKLSERQAAESYAEYELSGLTYDQEEEIFAGLPLMMQMEDGALLRALKGLTAQERQIFLSRVLDGKGFEALAAEYGMKYKGITTAYYRSIKKMKKIMEEAGK